MDKQQIDLMVSDKAKAAKSGMRILSLVSSEVRNNALQAMASAIRDNRGAILAANKIHNSNVHRVTLHGHTFQRSNAVFFLLFVF